MGRRLFVALAPGEAMQARLATAAAALRQRLGPLAGRLRWTDPASLHLTVRFLGDVEETRLAAVSAAVAAAARAGRPLSLEVGGPGAFPSARRPRALFLALGGEVEPLWALAAELEARLVAAGLAREPRPLSPHLTVARARERRGGPDLTAALAARVPDLVPWPVAALTLFQSHLGAGGARHEPLLVAPLGGPVG
jgi:2'-5' RNA ligase